MQTGDLPWDEKKLTVERREDILDALGIRELVNLFYSQQEAFKWIDLLWSEIVAYAMRSEIVRDRLRQSYEKCSGL